MMTNKGINGNGCRKGSLEMKSIVAPRQRPASRTGEGLRAGNAETIAIERT
jgi:hypothetical protein